MRRRTYLTTTGVVSTGLAGCTSLFGEEEPEEVGSPTRTDAERTDVDGTETPGEDEPPDERIRVLWLGGSEDGTHEPVELNTVLTPSLLEHGIELVYTERQADLDPETLSNYDAWLLYGNRYDLTPAQEDAVVDFVEGGGGFVALHSASASFPESDRFGSLLGGRFDWHGDGEMTTEHVRPEHPILDGVEPIESWDETYRHSDLTDDVEVLAYADHPSYDGEEPWTWVREQGEGRVFYTAWGHDERTWGTEGFAQLVERAVRWATGREESIGDAPALGDVSYHEADVPYYPANADDEVPEGVGEGMEWERMQHPLGVDRSMARTIVPGGFDLAHYVSEETLPDGVEGNIMDVAFDAGGRCWIALTRDYPNGLGGKRDRIVVCEDADGDGEADEFTVFAEGLSIPVSLTPVRDGIVVAELEEMHDDGRMLYLADTDGDGVADVEEELFSGFGTWDTHAGPNELAYGVDNWIWGVVGYAGFEGEVGGEHHAFSSAVYRFRPDGSELEVVAGLPGNVAGLGFDEAGLPFASAATVGQPTNYVSIPRRYYESVDGLDAPTLPTIADENRFLPITDRVRQFDLHGGFTAAANHEIYTARTYPERYWNAAAFVSDGTGHLLGTFSLEREGASYAATNDRNLATSTDEWFSPTYARVGPDGEVWFVDWYNFVFQHNPTPEGYRTGAGNAYVTDLRDHAHSRLYRVTYGDGAASGARDLREAGADELVAALSDDNMFWRRTAQCRLVERGERDVVPDLVGLIEDPALDEVGLDPGAVHALWTLHGLGVLEADGDADAIAAARSALAHPSAAVRLNALRALPGTAATARAILDAELLADEDGRVRAWACLALAETPPSVRAGEAIHEMSVAGDGIGDRVLIDAASIAAAQHASGFVSAYEAADHDEGEPSVGPNLLANPSFEESAAGGPAEWGTQTWSGSGDFSYGSIGHTGDHSVRIDSSSGADAAWNQHVSVEPNTDYELSGWIKTEDIAAGSGFGAQLNIHELGQDSLTDAVTGTTEWTQVSATVNSGTNETLQVNCLIGGWGESTGTAWWDDVSLSPIGDGGDGVHRIHDRVQRHLEGGADGDAGGPIETGSTIELGGEIAGWVGQAPDLIAAEVNPTLSLAAGAAYTVEWTNLDGAPHNFTIEDEDGEVLLETEIVSEGSQTVEFTATAEMAEYYCRPHSGSMRGDIEVITL